MYFLVLKIETKKFSTKLTSLRSMALDSSFLYWPILAGRNNGNIPVPLAPITKHTHFRVHNEYRLSHSRRSLFAKFALMCVFVLMCASQKLSVPAAGAMHSNGVRAKNISFIIEFLLYLPFVFDTRVNACAVIHNIHVHTNKRLYF